MATAVIWQIIPECLSVINDVKTILKGLGGLRNSSWGFLGDLADHVKNGSGNSAARNRDLNVWMPGQY